jgi:hypothetical protein
VFVSVDTLILLYMNFTHEFLMQGQRVNLALPGPKGLMERKVI